MISKALVVLAVMGLTVAGCTGSDDKAAGSADDGTNEIVKAKCKTKAGIKDCSDQTKRAKAIARETFALKEFLDPGLHDFARGKKNQSGEPMELVKLFVRHTEEDDEESFKQFKFKQDFKGYPREEQVAGLFASPEVAIDQAAAEVESWLDDPEAGENVRKRLIKLKDLGVVFGTHGFQQMGCAAPTAYLLVIDTAGKTVDGIDLNPCSES